MISIQEFGIFLSFSTLACHIYDFCFVYQFEISRMKQNLGGAKEKKEKKIILEKCYRNLLA